MWHRTLLVVLVALACSGAGCVDERHAAPAQEGRDVRPGALADAGRPEDDARRAADAQAGGASPDTGVEPDGASDTAALVDGARHVDAGSGDATADTGGSDAAGPDGSPDAALADSGGGSPACRAPSDCPGYGSPCTWVVCEAGECLLMDCVAPGHCLIDGVCYSEGAPNPGNDCETCVRPADCGGFEWTPRGDGAECGDGGACRAGVCEAQQLCIVFVTVLAADGVPVVSRECPVAAEEPSPCVVLARCVCEAFAEAGTIAREDVDDCVAAQLTPRALVTLADLCAAGDGNLGWVVARDDWHMSLPGEIRAEATRACDDVPTRWGP